MSDFIPDPDLEKAANWLGTPDGRTGLRELLKFCSNTAEDNRKKSTPSPTDLHAPFTV